MSLFEPEIIEKLLSLDKYNFDVQMLIRSEPQLHESRSWQTEETVRGLVSQMIKLLLPFLGFPPEIRAWGLCLICHQPSVGHPYRKFLSTRLSHSRF